MKIFAVQTGHSSGGKYVLNFMYTPKGMAIAQLGEDKIHNWRRTFERHRVGRSLLKKTRKGTPRIGLIRARYFARDVIAVHSLFPPLSCL